MIINFPFNHVQCTFLMILFDSFWYFQDERLSTTGSPARGLGSPLIENRGISRTSSKLRSTKSGFGALNMFHSSDDILIQVCHAIIAIIFQVVKSLGKIGIESVTSRRLGMHLSIPSYVCGLLDEVCQKQKQKKKKKKRVNE